MKRKFLIIILVLGTSISAIAQSKNAIQKVYDTFENHENVMSFSFNKNLTDILDTDFDWGDEMKHMEGDIRKMSTLIISEDDHSRSILKKMKRMIDDMGYKSIKLPDDEINQDDDEKIYVYAMGKKDRYSEIHMLIVDDDESGVLLSVFGDIIIKDIQ